jgi:hypothetical protein
MIAEHPLLNPTIITFVAVAVVCFICNWWEARRAKVKVSSWPSMLKRVAMSMWVKRSYCLRLWYDCFCRIWFRIWICVSPEIIRKWFVRTSAEARERGEKGKAHPESWPLYVRLRFVKGSLRHVCVWNLFAFPCAFSCLCRLPFFAQVAI